MTNIIESRMITNLSSQFPDEISRNRRTSDDDRHDSTLHVATICIIEPIEIRALNTICKTG